MRKDINKLLKKARETAKPDKCILCGKTQTSFCNSHSIPHMILKTIACEGKVLEPGVLMDEIDVVDLESGIKKSGTFHFICRECDALYFQDYENKEALLNDPTDKMLAEIALKSMLQMLSKRNEEIAFFDIFQKRSGAIINKERLDEDKLLDINDYMFDMDVYKRIIQNNEKDGFKIVFWEKLPYVTPIAVQTPITLYKDIEGTVINDIYNPDPNLHTQTMYMCVFPIEHETVVGVFYHKKDRNYRSFLHQMNCMSASNKLQYINYLIFANTENYYFSKTIEDIVRDNEKLKLLGQENNGEPHLGMLRPLEQLLEYKRIKPDEIPNFLMPEYKINS